MRRYRGQHVTERAAERRERFLRASIVVFAEKGYTSASVADICAYAGLSKRQFYEEFQTREDVLIASYDQIQAEIADAVGTVISATDPGLDRRSVVKTVLSALLAFIGDDPNRAKIIFVVVVGVSERMERRRRENRHTLAALFEAAIRLTGPQARPRGGSQLAISTLIGALNGLANEWLLTEPRVSVAELTELLVPVVDALIESPD